MIWRATGFQEKDKSCLLMLKKAFQVANLYLLL